MARTYASNFIHCIFSTKERRPILASNRVAALYAYLGGIARSEGFTLIAAGGAANHVHLLIVLPVTACLATAVQKLKGSSSRWMGKGFSWQEGYGAFSVSPSQVPAVKKYIANQEEHHRKHSSRMSSRLSCGVAGSSTIRGMCSGEGSCHRPYGTHIEFWYPYPTLKRGANDRCASGAR